MVVIVTVVTVVVRVTSFSKKQLDNLTSRHQCDVFRAAFCNLAIFYFVFELLKLKIKKNSEKKCYTEFDIGAYQIKYTMSN